VSARTGIFYFIIIIRVCVDATYVRAGGARVSADTACVRADRVLPCADAVKTRLRVKLHPGGKNGRTRISGR
jgi:hypothetical protein